LVVFGFCKCVAQRPCGDHTIALPEKLVKHFFKKKFPDRIAGVPESPVCQGFRGSKKIQKKYFSGLVFQKKPSRIGRKSPGKRTPEKEKRKNHLKRKRIKGCARIGLCLASI